MSAALKVVIVAVLVTFGVWLLGHITGLYDDASSVGIASIRQLDMPPRTVASVDGDWSQTDIITVLVPALFSGGALLGYTWPDPMTIVWATMGAMVTIAGLVVAARLLIKFLKAG